MDLTGSSLPSSGALGPFLSFSDPPPSGGDSDPPHGGVVRVKSDHKCHVLGFLEINYLKIGGSLVL